MRADNKDLFVVSRETINKSLLMSTYQLIQIMKCPSCGSIDTRVIDSRPAEDGLVLRRRRLCEACESRFTTYERVLEAPLVIVKRDGRREDFNAAKLRGGIIKACNKRMVSMDAINDLAANIEKTLRAETKSEIDTDRLGEMVMERLFQLDQVAYVRFASVYQRFDDVKRFAQLLERMTRRSRRKSSSTTAFSQEAEGNAE